MKKILFVVSTLQRSGPTNVLFNLITHLDPSKFKSIILTLSPERSAEPSLKPELEKLGVEIYSLGLTRVSGFLQGATKIKQFVKFNLIDIIHINGFRGDWMVNASDYKDLKIITTINSNIYDDYTMLYGKVKGRIMAFLHIQSIKDKITVGCSDFVASQVNKRYGSNLKVIYNGIPKERYTMAGSNLKAKVRSELSIPADKNVFIFVGHLIFRKDPLTVIEAFLNARARDSSVLLIIGDGVLLQEAKKKANDSNAIKFLGNQPETLKFLHASDYYIASSISEGLPTSVMEAMGCGLPVILSEIDSHNEILDKINSWDYTFPVYDTRILTQKIDKIIEDNYENISAKCRNVIEDHINADLMSYNYQKIYQS